MLLSIIRLPNTTMMKLVLSVVLLAVCAQSIDVVPTLNVTAYLGRWYQVRRLRNTNQHAYPINRCILISLLPFSSSKQTARLPTVRASLPSQVHGAHCQRRWSSSRRKRQRIQFRASRNTHSMLFNGSFTSALIPLLLGTSR